MKKLSTYFMGAEKIAKKKFVLLSRQKRQQKLAVECSNVKKMCER